MCDKNSLRSPLALKLAKITVVIIFFCFAECAAGSCLSYGHACWGAHGKRNGVKTPTPSEKDTQWFLSRLVQPSLRYINDIEVPTVNQQQLFSEAQVEAALLRGQEDLKNLQDLYSNEENLSYDEIYPNQRSNKIKPAKLLEKRSTRLI